MHAWQLASIGTALSCRISIRSGYRHAHRRGMSVRSTDRPPPYMLLALLVLPIVAGAGDRGCTTIGMHRERAAGTFPSSSAVL